MVLPYPLRFDLQILLEVTTPIFLIIGGGYLVTHFGYMKLSAAEGLMFFVQNIALPVMLFNAMSKIDLGVGFNFKFLLSFYTGCLLSFIIALTITHLYFKRSWEDSVVIAFAALFGNTVLLGLAVVDRALGTDSLTGAYIIVAFHAPFCFLVGITTMELYKSREKTGRDRPVIVSLISLIWKNAILMGMILGLIFNLLGLSLPEVLAVPVNMVAGSAIPAALFALGGILSQYKPTGDFKIIAMVCFLTLIFHPFVAWVLSSLVFDIPKPLIQSAVITASMPPGLNAFIFASIYGRGTRIAASSVLVGTIMAVFTSSIILYLIA